MATTAEIALILKAQDNASAIVKKVSGELSGLSSGAKSSGSAFSAMGGAVKNALAVVGGFAVFSKLTGAISDAAGAAIGFEKSMSAIKAVSGATGPEMQRLSGLALQLGKDTSFSAGEAAKGIEELLKGGVSVGDIFGGAASAALDLAAAGGLSVGEAATIASNALNQFNLKGTDMAHVADLVAGAANASSISVSDFNMSLASGGAVAAAAGQSIDAFATAVALMGAQGIKGSDAGTSLKAMFNTLIPTTDTATQKMRDLGIITSSGANQFIDAAGRIKDYGQIAEILQTQTAGLTESQKLLAMEVIFGSDGMRAALVAAKAGGEGYAEMGAKMLEAGGAAAVAKEKLNNLSGDIETLKGSIETAGIVILSEFLPALRGIGQGATAAVNTFIQEAQTLIQTAKNIAGAQGIGLIPAALTAIELRVGEVFGPKAQGIVHVFRETAEKVGEVMGDVAGAMEPVVHQFASWTVDSLPVALRIVRDLIDPLGQMAKALQSNATATNALTGAMGGLLGAAALGGVASAVMKVGAVLLAINPVVLAFALLAATAGAAWATNFGGIQEIMAESAAVAALAFEAMGRGSEQLVSQFNGMSAGAIAALNGMASAIGDAFAALGTRLAALGGEMAAHADVIAVALITGLVGGLAGLVGLVVTALIGVITGGTAGAAADATTGGSSIGANIAKGMAAGISGGLAWVTTAATNLANAAKAAAQWALGEHSLSKVFKEIGENVDLGFIAGIDALAPDVVTAISDLMTGAGEAAIQSSEEAFAGLATMLGAQFEKTYDLVEAAQMKGHQAIEDAEGDFQRAQDKAERQFLRKLQDLREEAGRATVKNRADVLQKIAQLEENYGRQRLDMAAAQEDKLFDLELDVSDNVRKAEAQQNLERGKALRDFQRGSEDVLRETTQKAAEIGRKVGEAVSESMRDAADSIIEVRDRAAEAIQSLQENQGASRALRTVRDDFGTTQDDEGRAFDTAQAIVEADYQLAKDLANAKIKLGKARSKAETDDERRQADIQYAEETANIRESFAAAKVDLAHRQEMEERARAFRKQQQKALQAFNDALEDKALASQIVRIQEERDSRIKEIGVALDEKLTKIRQSEADERAALQVSADEKMADLRERYYDKIGQANEEATAQFEAIFATIAAGVAAAAGAVSELSSAIASVPGVSRSTTAATPAGGGSGSTWANQTQAVRDMFTDTWGSGNAQAQWESEHAGEMARAGNAAAADLPQPTGHDTISGLPTGPGYYEPVPNTAYWRENAHRFAPLPYGTAYPEAAYGSSDPSSQDVFGGNNSSVYDQYAKGGVVPGPTGAARRAVVHGGETIRTPEQERALGGAKNQGKPRNTDGAVARAAGGPVRKGASYLVGEKGPERFVPKEDGTILSAARTRQRTPRPAISAIASQTMQAAQRAQRVRAAEPQVRPALRLAQQVASSTVGGAARATVAAAAKAAPSPSAAPAPAALAAVTRTADAAERWLRQGPPGHAGLIRQVLPAPSLIPTPSTAPSLSRPLPSERRRAPVVRPGRPGARGASGSPGAPGAPAGRPGRPGRSAAASLRTALPSPAPLARMGASAARVAQQAQRVSMPALVAVPALNTRVAEVRREAPIHARRTAPAAALAAEARRRGFPARRTPRGAAPVTSPERTSADQESAQRTPARRGPAKQTSAGWGGAAWKPEQPPLERRAKGGPVRAGQDYIVGERGPERFRPQRSGTVLPAPATGAARLTAAAPGAGPAGAPAALAGLARGEGRTTIILEIDGQRFASATVPYIQGALDRQVRLRLG